MGDIYNTHAVCSLFVCLSVRLYNSHWKHLQTKSNPTKRKEYQETYSELCQTSKVELFAKIVHGL